MTAKKYLNLDEAAQVLGVRTDELIRMRERGELRGFADRGTWKFKAEDVLECQRRRQPDSSPEVPLMSDDSALEMDIVSPGPQSDSDVRLIVAEGGRKPLAGSSTELPMYQAPGSDSDVRLVGPSAKKPESDSDVKLISAKDSDSQVKLSDSDSDVRLAGGSSGAGIRLADSDSDVRLAPPGDSDSDVKLVDSSRRAASDSSFVLSSDSRVSGVSDSVLLDDDEGITLASDSGISLAEDSGIQLSTPGDSGISLADDSALDFMAGSSLKGKPGQPSGPAPKTIAESAEDEFETTIPMLLSDDDVAARTDPQVPLLAPSEEEEERDLMPKNFLGAGGGDTEAETAVLMFEDEEEEAAPSKRAKGGKKGSDEQTVFGLEAEEGEEELEIAAEDFEEAEEVDLFEADEAAVESGMSAADFPIAAGRLAVPLEREWDGWAMAGVIAMSILMALGAWTAADLLHTVSTAGAPSHEGLAGFVGQLFK
uniref:DNA-binding protein n=1 Tax=Schlesneria paludicola TaxID=360056 RepID=A0A7C4QP98_9PLAN